MSKISCDYIAAVKKGATQLESIKVSIPKPVTLIDELQAMVENPNRTVYDLQCKFSSDYHFSEKSWYICYPYSYESSYLSPIKCPKIKSYYDIKDSWEKALNEKIQSYKTECESNSKAYDESEALSLAEKYVEEVKKNQKQKFVQDCKLWINTNELQVQSLKLNNQYDILMYSKENIGWNNFTYRISDDLNISIATNFGYGSAAYFFLSVKYKDLEIVPYSFIVKYYKAFMADIVRCTRQYSPRRDSWEAAFDFVVDIANQSQSNPECFIRKYVMNEVTEMMSGLKSIIENTQAMRNKMINFRSPELVINVRDILNNEKDRMRAFPQESLFIFKVEKITGALHFLQSLKNVASTFESLEQDINVHIDTLLAYNYELYPEIQKQYNVINNRIEAEKNRLSSKENDRQNVISQINPYEEQIDAICKEIQDWSERYKEREKFKKANPLYVQLLSKKEALDSEISKIRDNISEYDQFNNMLKQSMYLIDSVRKVA